MIGQKHCKFSILQVIQAYKPAFILDEELGTAQIAWAQAFYFVFSSYIYY